jgi:hypothetical protein
VDGTHCGWHARTLPTSGIWYWRRSPAESDYLGKKALESHLLADFSFKRVPFKSAFPADLLPIAPSDYAWLWLQEVLFPAVYGHGNTPYRRIAPLGPHRLLGGLRIRQVRAVRRAHAGLTCRATRSTCNSPHAARATRTMCNTCNTHHVQHVQHAPCATRATRTMCNTHHAARAALQVRAEPTPCPGAQPRTWADLGRDRPLNRSQCFAPLGAAVLSRSGYGNATVAPVRAAPIPPARRRAQARRAPSIAGACCWL